MTHDFNDMEFYSVRHNSFRTSGVPWISGAYSPDHISHECKECGYYQTEPTGQIELRPTREKGTFWPDVIGCGGGIMGLYISQSVKADWDSNAIMYGKSVPAVVAKPYPYNLVDTLPPDYFCVVPHEGATMDFEKSGFILKGHCPSCGRVLKDASSKPNTYTRIEGTWDGTDVFVSDMSPSVFLCTERVLQLAARFKRTNFHFAPLHKATDASFKGLDYLSSPA